MWGVDAFLGIDGVFAYGDRDTSVFSTAAVFRYQEVLVYPLSNSDRSKSEDHRGIVAIFILLIKLDYVPLCLTPCVKQWRSGKQDRPILCPH